MRAISSSLVGGGIGEVTWVINLTVDTDYKRFDPEAHLSGVADGLELQGRGIAMMTAVDVGKYVAATDAGANAWATVGVRIPVWAADRNRPHPPLAPVPGTINLVCGVPARLCDAAMVNAIATMTEAKVQALQDYDVAGTGTASDALCLLCPIEGAEEPFGGPRSLWGGRLAQATYDAIATGLVRQRESTGP
jgi:adenosylcobinamide hydrolase